MTDFFQDITFQQPLVSRFKQEIDQQTVSHAYLFMGPPGVGKKSLALRFAFSLLAQSDPGAALFFQEQRHPDLLILSRPEHKTVLTKSQITEELIPWLGYKPYQAQKKVALVYDAHCLSPEGANALLKTLEEPPEYTVLILVSDQENLLETICSRCRIVDFPPIPDEEVAVFLKKQGCEDAIAREIALVSRGDLTLAQTFLQADLSSLRQKARELLDDLQTGRHEAIFTLATALEKEGKPLFHFIWMLLRDQLIWEETGRAELMLLTGPSPQNHVALAPRQQILENWIRIQSLWQLAAKNVNIQSISVNIAWALYHCFVF